MLAEINKFTTEEKEQYLKSLGNMGDEEGKAESKLETAKNFKALGVATDIISKATGLPVEIIEKLK